MAGVEKLKAENIIGVRKCFYEQDEPLTRGGISEHTGLSMAGTLNILKLLMERGEIRYGGDAPSTGGRKSKLYALNPDYAHIGMIFLEHLRGEYRISSSSMDLTGNYVSDVRTISPASAGPRDVVNAAHDLTASDNLIRTIVVSVPGIVEEEGILLDNDFPALSGVNLRQMIEERCACSVSIENDVNLAAVGYSMKHRECENLAVLYQPDGDGAGAGLIIGGNLYRGFHGFAGEIGRFFFESDKYKGEKAFAFLKEHPAAVLQMEMTALIRIVSPERLAYFCPMVHEDLDLPEKNGIPEKARPVIERLEGLESLLFQGSLAAGKNNISEV